MILGILGFLGVLGVRAQDSVRVVDLPEGQRVELVWVEGGSFTMGSNTARGVSHNYDATRPEHAVTVDGFYMARFEVTQGVWRSVMGENPSKFRQHDSLPVEQVSWSDAQQFVTMLSQMTGQRFRLPTEAEWEYAARGGRQSKGYLFAGSNDPQKVAWCEYDTIYKRGYSHQPVRTLQPNELGLYDMSGGVWEWCSNDYQHYVSDRSGTLARLFRSNFKVIRGGSFNNKPSNARVTNRFMYVITRRKPTVGLRLAL